MPQQYSLSRGYFSKIIIFWQIWIYQSIYKWKLNAGRVLIFIFKWNIFVQIWKFHVLQSYYSSWHLLWIIILRFLFRTNFRSLPQTCLIFLVHRDKIKILRENVTLIKVLKSWKAFRKHIWKDALCKYSTFSVLNIIKI